jgi:cytochrome c556
MRAPLVAAAALLALAIPAIAQDVIAARKSNFTAIRDDFRWINQQQNAGDLGAIAQRSSAILERAQRISGYFPTGSETGGNTNALATVWSEKATFDQRAADLVTRVREMEAAARSGDRAALQASVRNTGAACQACHDRFRRPLS